MKTEIYELEVHSYNEKTIYRVGEYTVKRIELIGFNDILEYKITYMDDCITYLRGNFNYIERHRENDNKR